MDLARLLERIEEIRPPSTAVLGAQTVAFTIAGVLFFYSILDTVGLESGPLDPNTMLLLLFVGLSVGAAVFLAIVDIPYSYYLFVTVIAAPMIIAIRGYLLHGPAGVDSPVTGVFMALIVAALLFGGSIEVVAQRVSSNGRGQGGNR